MTLAELDLTMALCGLTGIKEIGPHCLAGPDGLAADVS
jgi:hypothetical protein